MRIIHAQYAINASGQFVYKCMRLVRIRRRASMMQLNGGNVG